MATKEAKAGGGALAALLLIVAALVGINKAKAEPSPEEPPLPDPEFRNLTVRSVSSPVDVGDSCIVSCRWEYRGPAISKTLYASIGNSGLFGFDEILSASSERSIPESPSWRTLYATAVIPITAALDPADSPYDVYAKLTGVGNDPISPTRENILVMSGGESPPGESPPGESPPSGEVKFTTSLIMEYSPYTGGFNIRVWAEVQNLTDQIQDVHIDYSSNYYNNQDILEEEGTHTLLDLLPNETRVTQFHFEDIPPYYDGYFRVVAVGSWGQTLQVIMQL